MYEEKLIRAVKQYRELYDPAHINYMKRSLKRTIWSDIAKELNLKDGKEAKYLWLKLRGCFRDARRRHKKLIKSGTPPDYVKPWKLQEQMSFLERYMTSGSRDGNRNDDSDGNDEDPLDDPLPESSKLEHLDNDDMESVRSENEEFTQMGVIGIVKVDEEGMIVNQPLFNENDDELRHVKKKCHNKIRYVADDGRRLDLSDDGRKLREERRTTDDPLYNFFMSMYQLSKNMPPHYQHRVRAQVFQAVSDAEAEIMNINFN